MSLPRLTEVERVALDLAERSPLVSGIPDRVQRDEVGQIQPGRGVFRRLARHGLLHETVEEPILVNGIAIALTPSIELTEAGQRLLERLRRKESETGAPADGV